MGIDWKQEQWSMLLTRNLFHQIQENVRAENIDVICIKQAQLSDIKALNVGKHRFHGSCYIFQR